MGIPTRPESGLARGAVEAGSKAGAWVASALKDSKKPVVKSKKSKQPTKPKQSAEPDQSVKPQTQHHVEGGEPKKSLEKMEKGREQQEDGLGADQSVKKQ